MTVMCTRYSVMYILQDPLLSDSDEKNYTNKKERRRETNQEFV